MIIGSVYWRFLNYGPKAVIRYLLSRNNKKLQTSDLSSFEELYDLNAKEFLEEYSDFIHQGIQNIYTEFFTDKLVKNVFQDVTINRIILVGILITSQKYDKLVEMGTQNGISISMFNLIKEKSASRIKLYTLDVENHVKKLEDGVSYIKLKWPARDSFKKFARSDDFTNSIFFHDSDHSYENMSFEFKYAWDRMKVAVIVSDDVERNTAFKNFCNERNLTPKYFKIDSGPVVGIVFRIF
jgi:hypothetical protein